MLKGTDSQEMEVDKSHVTTASIMYDAIFIPGGKKSVEAMMKEGDVKHFINEAFKHCKPIGALGEGVDLVMHSDISGLKPDEKEEGTLTVDAGVVTLRKAADYNEFTRVFAEAIAQHRHWDREEKMQVPA